MVKTLTMEATIKELIAKANKKMAEDEDLKEKTKDLKKTINFDLGEEKYSMKLENSEITDFKAEPLENADITVTTTPEYFQQLVDGDLRPMRAYVTKKITVKGKIQDLMFLKSMF